MRPSLHPVRTRGWRALCWRSVLGALATEPVSPLATPRAAPCAVRRARSCLTTPLTMTARAHSSRLCKCAGAPRRATQLIGPMLGERQSRIAAPHPEGSCHGAAAVLLCSVVAAGGPFPRALTRAACARWRPESRRSPARRRSQRCVNACCHARPGFGGVRDRGKPAAPTFILQLRCGQDHTPHTARAQAAQNRTAASQSRIHSGRPHHHTSSATRYRCAR